MLLQMFCKRGCWDVTCVKKIYMKCVGRRHFVSDCFNCISLVVSSQTEPHVLRVVFCVVCFHLHCSNIALLQTSFFFFLFFKKESGNCRFMEFCEFPKHPPKIPIYVIFHSLSWTIPMHRCWLRSPKRFLILEGISLYGL